MAIEHLRAGHVKLIARSNVKYGIRGGTGLVFTFLSLVVGLIVASIFISPLDALSQAESEMGSAEVRKVEIVDKVVEEVGKPVIKKLISGGDAQVDFLLFKKPAIVSAILVLMMMLAPFLVALGSFNQLSGDIGSKGLRYLLLRTERSNLFIGRFIGTFIFTMCVLVLLMAVIAIYLVAKVKIYPAGDVLLWVAQGTLALAIFSLPYVALCAWISASTDSAGMSMVVSQMLIGFIPLFLWLAERAEKKAGYLGYLTPWDYKYMLLHPSPAHWLGGTAALLGFTGLFLWLGLRTFQKRDL